MKSNRSTYSNKKAKPITLKDVKKTYELLDKIPNPEVNKIEFGSRKRMRAFVDNIKDMEGFKDEKGKTVFNFGSLGALYGIPVKVNPLLPKNFVMIGDKIFRLE